MQKCLVVYFSWALDHVSHNGAVGNSFSNQWSLTMLETEAFKYNVLNFYIAENYAVYFVEICIVVL